jgi:predicted nucleic acid-binding protein
MADEEQRTIPIDDKEYDIESLSDEAKKQIVSMRVADEEIAALQRKLAIAQTARNAYANALREELPEEDS